MRAVLEVRDVAKSFGGVQAVRGVSFDVREGDVGTTSVGASLGAKSADSEITIT